MRIPLAPAILIFAQPSVSAWIPPLCPFTNGDLPAFGGLDAVTKTVRITLTAYEPALTVPYSSSPDNTDLLGLPGL